MRFRASLALALLAGCGVIELHVAADREGETEDAEAEPSCDPEASCECDDSGCACTADEDCTVVCGEDCDLLCQQSGSCDFTCGAGSTVDCKNQSSCTVGCTDDCVVKCTSTGGCDITCEDPSLPLTSCTGSTQACGPCP